MIGKVADALVMRAVWDVHTSIIGYRNGAAPKILHDNFSAISTLGAVDQFVDATYVLSPFFQAFRLGRLPSFSRASKLVAETGIPDFANGVHLAPQISLKPDSVADEVIYSATAPGEAVIYSVLRASGRSKFTDQEVDALEARREVVCELLEQLLKAHKEDMLADDQISLDVSKSDQRQDDDIGSFIKGMFSERLSPRERSAITLMLQGKSPDLIAHELGISPHTVRVHMRNAYTKLKVRNRLELVGMFVRRAESKANLTRASDDTSLAS